MAKKEKPNKPVIPTSIMGLDNNVADLTRSVNRTILDNNKGRKDKKTDEKEEVSELAENEQTIVRGRPKRVRQKIETSNKGTEWETFLDYNTQYVTKGWGSEVHILVDANVKKRFERLKLVLGEKAYIGSLVNAALMAFWDTNKEKILELINNNMMDGI